METAEKIVATIIGLIILLVIGLPIHAMFISNIGATSGTHKGVITAVETNSFIVTNQRAYVKSSAETTQEDTYCVQDQNVYKKLEEASQNSEVVTIKFAHPLVEWRWNCSGEGAIITEVIK